LGKCCALAVLGRQRFIRFLTPIFGYAAAGYRAEGCFDDSLASSECFGV